MVFYFDFCKNEQDRFSYWNVSIDFISQIQNPK